VANKKIIKQRKETRCQWRERSCIDVETYRADRQRRRWAQRQWTAERQRHTSRWRSVDTRRTSCHCTDCPGTWSHSSVGSWTAGRDVSLTSPADEAPCSTYTCTGTHALWPITNWIYINYKNISTQCRPPSTAQPNPDRWPSELNIGTTVTPALWNLGFSTPFVFPAKTWEPVRDKRTYRGTDGRTDEQRRRVLRPIWTAAQQIDKFNNTLHSHSWLLNTHSLNRKQFLFS